MNKGITAIYCRIAHPCDAGDFPAITQKERLLRFAEGHGYENIKFYEDIGYSGAAMANRPAFQRLQRDIDAGKVQTVIARNIERVGRNMVEVLRWMDGLRKKGVAFITEAYPAPTLDMLAMLYPAESEVAVDE